MTSPGDFPPHEARGGLGNVMDPGGGGNTIKPSPLPNAITGGGPGLSSAALHHPAQPTITGVDDPQAIALLVAKLAGEWFGGSSASAVPMTPSVSSGWTSPPSSPGISPALFTTPTDLPGSSADPSVLVLPATSHANASSVSNRSHANPSNTNPSNPSYANPSNRSHANPSNPNSSNPNPSNPNPSNPFDVAPDLSMLDGGMPFADLRLPILGTPHGGDVSSLDLSVLEGTRFDAPRFDALSTASSPFDAPVTPSFDSAPPRLDNPGYEIGSTNDDAVIRELGGIGFDPYRVRRDFPILEERVHGKRLVWLDNAATTQKPLAVIERLSEFYKHENSNIHRAAHTLAARATDAYEKARETTRKFLNASSTNEIIFVRGATEGINLVAQSWGRKNVSAGDEIVITHLEHHANIVPWQMLCSEKGARLRVAPVDDRGQILLEEYEKLLSPRTKLVALPQVSNALGTITPAREMVEMAHRYGARVLVDGAQAVSHMRVDVQVLDCDFYVFSGHKVFAPTGIGAVYGKRDVLDAMPPWQGGGNMIQDVTFERTTYHPAPFRFEAGTGNIADAAGLGAALDYVMNLGLDTIDRYEHELLVYATDRLARVPGLRMIGTAPDKAGVLSFILDGQRTEDVGAALDQEGIAVRSGHHCAQPILRRFGVEATVRASLAFYNVCEDVDALVDALMRMQATHARRG